MTATFGNRRRAGAVLVAVLVVMMVASVLVGAMLRAGREEHRLYRQQQLRWQATELAQAGVERAVARLQSNPSYQAETWQVPATDLPSHLAAAIRIEIRRPEDFPRRRRILVEVNYPPTGESRVRHRLEAVLDLPAKE